MRFDTLIFETRRLFFILSTSTGKWKKSHITYYIENYNASHTTENLTEQDIRSTIQRAMKVKQTYEPLLLNSSSSSSFFSSVGCADDEALTRLFQTSFLFAFWSLYQSW